MARQKDSTDMDDGASTSSSSGSSSEEPELQIAISPANVGGPVALTPLQIGLRASALVWIVVGIGVLCCSFGNRKRQLDLISAMYVLVQIITTVGYGDLVPQGDVMRTFMTVYVFLGNILAALVITEQLQKMVRRTHDVLKLNSAKAMVEGAEAARRGRLQKKRFKNSLMNGKYERLVWSAFAYAGMLVVGTIFYCLVDFCKCAAEGCIASLDMCAESGGEQRHFIDSVYMAVITLTTVGFGDELPHSWQGRLFGIFWMLAGVASMANFLGELAHVLLMDSMDKNAMHGLSKELFQMIDDDNSGTLTKFEFVTYMLVKYGMVSEDDLTRLMKEFDKFDTDNNGELTYEEITGDAEPGHADQGSHQGNRHVAHG